MPDNKKRISHTVITTSCDDEVNAKHIISAQLDFIRGNVETTSKHIPRRCNSHAYRRTLGPISKVLTAKSF